MRTQTRKRRDSKKQVADRDFQSPSGEVRFAPLVPFVSKSQNQDMLMKALFSSPLTVALGPAGTGKSFSGARVACELLQKRIIDKIVITRNPLPTGASLGFFAGSEAEKMTVWLGPIISTLKKILKTASGSDGLFEYLVRTKAIEYLPMEVAKGSSFDNAFIIVEEAQECDLEQLKVLTTRVGTNSKIFLNGDLAQSNRRLDAVGLKRLVDAFEKENEYSITAKADWDRIIIPIIEFTSGDIIRSDITRKVVNIFDKHNL